MPRYTGVTLSLLSMMVLASMLVVWKKIQPEEENADLRLLVTPELRESIAEISNHFRDEYGYEFLITTFENEEQLEEIIHNRDDEFDLLIASNEYDFRTIMETNGTFSEIPICFHSPSFDLNTMRPLQCIRQSFLHGQEITSRRFGSPATSQHQVKDNMFLHRIKSLE